MSRIMRSIRCIALLCCTFIIAVEGLPSEDDTMRKYASGELLAEARQSYTNWYWNKLHHAQVELLSWICSQVRGDENAQTEAQIFSCVEGLSDTDCTPHLERKKSELMKTDGIVMLQLFSGAQSIDSLVSQMFLVLPELLVLVIGIRHKILGNPKDQSLKAIIRELLEKHLFNGASAHTGSFFPAQTLGYNVLGNTITLHSYSLLQWLELFSIHTDVIFLWEAQKTVCDLAGKESSVLRREPPDTVEMIDDLLNLTLSYASKHDAVPWLRVHLKLPGNDEEHYEEVPFPELVSTMETLKKVIAESTSFLNLKHSSVLHELPNFENFLQELETTCTDRETERVKLELEIRKLRTRLDALLMAQRAENTTALKNFITGLKILTVHTSAESVSRHENRLSQHLTLLNEIKKKWDLVPFDDSRTSFSSHLQMLRVDIVVLRLLCDSSRALVNTQPREWAAALVDLGEEEQPADLEQVIGQIVHIEKELQILKSVVTAIPNVPNTELNALVPKIKAIKGDFFFLVDENLHSALSKLKETLSTCREQLDRLKSIYRRKVEDQERILEECFAKRNHGTYTLDSIDETLFSDKRKFDEYESTMLNFHNEVPKLLESLDELQIGYHRAVALLLHCETLNIELNNELRICMQMQLKHLQECAASISLGVTATKTTQLMAVLEETRCQTNLIESTTLEVVNCLTRRASFEELRTTWSKKDQDSLQKRIENQEMVITELTTKFQEHYDTTDEQRSGLIRNKIKDLEDKLKSLQGKRAVSEEILASCVILLEAFTQKNMQMLQGVQSSRALVVSWKDQMTVILSHYFIQVNAVSQLEKMHVELTKELEMLRAELEEGRRTAQLLAHDEQRFLYQTQIEQMQHAASQSEYASLQQNLFKLREEQKTYNKMKDQLTEKTKSTAAMKEPQKPIGKFDTTTHQDPGSSESTPKKLSPYIIALIIIGSLILFLLVVCFIYCCCFTAYGAPALSFLVRSSSKYGDKHKNQPAHALSSTGVDDSFIQVVMDDVLEERPHESFL